MPERMLEIPSFEEIRRILGDNDDTAAPAPANDPDRRPDDTTENDDD
ncbi:hypothetical protein [Luteimonas terricola]|uniref:Uncharacterized protein n=1 Tax=Luteimonas terricola TaxID=645597 RepID=A0ABQ2ELJ9_9GAMM|nr:hypothetical protein [Luteimonas terricola]GGK15861.1 hypothetical protein GCM10011394_26340 [Luteimonas terricola]